MHSFSCAHIDSCFKIVDFVHTRTLSSLLHICACVLALFMRKKKNWLHVFILLAERVLLGAPCSLKIVPRSSSSHTHSSSPLKCVLFHVQNYCIPVAHVYSAPEMRTLLHALVHMWFALQIVLLNWFLLPPQPAIPSSSLSLFSCNPSPAYHVLDFFSLSTLI